MATDSQIKMTAEEFLALPEVDGVRRELIRGELKEYPMTTRNSKHSYAISRISYFLSLWMENQPQIIGVVVSGDARCQLLDTQENVVGIDVAVFLGEAAIDAVEQGGSFFGPPALAVEVLSLSDTQEHILDKLHLYREANTPLLWIVDPELQTITVHRPNQPPVLFNRTQTISGEPELAGFQVDVSSFFDLRRTAP